jgi:formylglycine-generating enzyme required for sulfatase activity
MTPQPPRPCCVPSRGRLARLDTSIQMSFHRPRATAGSLENMVRVEDTRFRMGSESPEAITTDSEGPVRTVTLAPFYISKYAVTNTQFAEFVRTTGYRTEASRHGWSFVFRNHKASQGVKSMASCFQTSRKSTRCSLPSSSAFIGVISDVVGPHPIISNAHPA